MGVETVTHAKARRENADVANCQSCKPGGKMRMRRGCWASKLSVMHDRRELTG